MESRTFAWIHADLAECTWSLNSRKIIEQLEMVDILTKTYVYIFLLSCQWTCRTVFFFCKRDLPLHKAPSMLVKHLANFQNFTLDILLCNFPVNIMKPFSNDICSKTPHWSQLQSIATHFHAGGLPAPLARGPRWNLEPLLIYCSLECVSVSVECVISAVPTSDILVWIGLHSSIAIELLLKHKVQHDKHQLSNPKDLRDTSNHQ